MHNTEGGCVCERESLNNKYRQVFWYSADIKVIG